jgi:hypothetical protein
MAKPRHIATGLRAASALIAVAILGSAPAFAQDHADGADSYSAGVDFGRTLHDARKCGGRGDYYEGCIDGAQESQFDEQADQALSSGTFDAKPPENPPVLSPPSGSAQDPNNKPGDIPPPND